MAPTPSLQKTCGSCGAMFAPEDLAVFGDHMVCAACQPGFVQSYRQGMVDVAGPRELHYAGFWIRFCAELIDVLIVAALQFVLSLWGAVWASAPSPAVSSDIRIIGVLADLFYYCYFWTHSGATPGKMLLGLKVIDASGGPVALGQAVKRWFSQLLSGALLGYGFMKAGWSPGKRSLHDGIAHTRVIYSR